MKRISNLSRDNVKFAHKLVKAADVVYEYTPVNIGHFYIETGQVQFPPELKNFDPQDFVASSRVTLPVPKFQQHRLLVLHEHHGRHVTLEFSADNSLAYIPPNSSYQVNEAGSILVVCRGTSRTSSVEDHANYPPTQYVIRLILVEGTNLGEWAHVTVDSGLHWPMWMKDVALALRRGDTSIELPCRKTGQDNIRYDLSSCQREPCKISFLCEFYI